MAGTLLGATPWNLLSHTADPSRSSVPTAHPLSPFLSFRETFFLLKEPNYEISGMQPVFISPKHLLTTPRGRRPPEAEDPGLPEVERLPEPPFLVHGNRIFTFSHIFLLCP